jgi:hypothetical protein
MIAKNFKHVLEDQLNSLSIRILENILSYYHLRIKNDDFLLKSIFNLTKNDPNKKILMKNVQFHAVSAQMTR